MNRLVHPWAYDDEGPPVEVDPRVGQFFRPTMLRILRDLLGRRLPSRISARAMRRRDAAVLLK